MIISAKESAQARKAFTLTLASFSILFYVALAVVAFAYYRKFRLIQIRNNNSAQYYRSNLGKFDDAKVLFFLVLGCSALLDVPIYFGCIANDGPNDCSYATSYYEVFYFMHLIAVCGYAYTIMIPCVLWSDMINRKDGKLFFSKYPSDPTKRFFQLSLLLYVLNTVIDVICGFFYFRTSNPTAYQSNIVDEICTFLEPIIIFGIAVGCLWCSVRLQLYVTRARLGLQTELRFLLYMNFTMFIIVISYLARALFVLRLVSFMPDSYNNHLKVSYLVWLLCTRWLPYIFCSFCLVYMMRASGEEVAARQQQGNIRLIKTPSESESLPYISGGNSNSRTSSGRSGGILTSQHEYAKDSSQSNSSDHNRSILTEDHYAIDEDSMLSESLLIHGGYGYADDGRISGSYNSPSFLGGLIASISPPKVFTLQQERANSALNTPPRIFSADAEIDGNNNFHGT